MLFLSLISLPFRIHGEVATADNGTCDCSIRQALRQYCCLLTIHVPVVAQTAGVGWPGLHILVHLQISTLQGEDNVC